MNSTEMNSVSPPGDEPKRDGERGKQILERSEERFENKRLKVSQVDEKSTKNENPPPSPSPPPPPTTDALALTLKPVEGGDVDEKNGNEEEEEAAIDVLRDIEVDAFVMDTNHDDEKPVALDFDLNELPSEVDQDWW